MGQLIKRENIRSFVEKLQAGGKTVVVTNGCFDILHVGHVRYLQKTKSFADYLIVLLNSDKSVKAIKGESRPSRSRHNAQKQHPRGIYQLCRGSINNEFD